jgi:PIN domain nuclease of toxin-antitoxin system
MIVVDTCAALWDALEPGKLTAKAKKAIAHADENRELLLCDISLWEIAMLVNKKRVGVDETPANLMRLILGARHYTVLGITPEMAELSVTLGSEINGDPADRLIVAASILHQAPIVTADANLLKSRLVETIW